MTPVLEIAHVGLSLAVASELGNLVVVELGSDDAGDVLGARTSSDVLTVSTTTHLGVVGVGAGGSNRACNAGEGVVPSDVRSSVVGTMVVVVVYDSLLVGRGGGSSSDCGWRGSLFG